MDSHTKETNPTDSTTTIASFPFNDTNADLILRSSERVDFYVHKSLLSLASPVFRDMFDIGQAAQTLQGGIPVVQMSEDSDVLHKLLIWCDPRSILLPKQFTIDDISRVLSLTDKFMMEGIAGRVSMLLSEYVKEQPARVYALAYRGCGSWGAELMRAAAWQTLKSDFPHHTRAFDDISAKALMRLYEYRIDCITAAQSLITDLEWIPIDKPWQHRQSSEQFGCRCIFLKCAGGWTHVARWFVEYLQCARNSLKEKPCREAIFQHDLGPDVIDVESRQIAPIPHPRIECSARDLDDSKTRTSFSLFQQEFANEIDRVTKKVLDTQVYSEPQALTFSKVELVID
ncbi:uncharacterized protein EV420DRAFT_1260509 [Desarmillaria tabescens]|uniref:BTB domain-containing protein n=1 Tax=Armillaria tabescens TaxID=1929756 RepID=A0AA39NJT1_ARMTA|nr:uncharacterized protein EV420DRAFT_1260509 [Desarmillaria tabescens]KAK0466953.1 hypothetical protein EV420DRAFT_1260509 [Desarmillaria tabescens]